MSSTPRPALSLLLLLILGGCAGPSEPVAVGARMPAFDLESRDGSKIESRSLAGAPAVVAFWATWCQPCLRDIPELNLLASADGMTVIAVSLDAGGWETIDPFLADHPFDATVLLGDEEVFRRFGGFTIPYTLVVDGQQTIRAIFRGAVTRDAVLGSLEAAG